MKIYNDRELNASFDWREVVVLTGCAFALGFFIALIVSGAL
jgi:hypothetical protein